jgi:N-acetylneuraminate synthase
MGLLESLDERVFIIAEIGCNHGGDMAVAKRLVDAAREAGADAAKFQSFVPEEMITTDAPKADYQIRATGTEESQFERLKRMALDKDQHLQLKAYCGEKGILFCSSPFDIKSAEMLDSMDVPFFKLGSGEITNIPLLERIASMRRPLMLSTGMADAAEIGEALEALGPEMMQRTVLLHCVSSYPSLPEEANLRAIRTLGERFGLPVGFSDHSDDISLSLAAVSVGARVIERHITLDRNMEGGDHKASLEPEAFGLMVKEIRRLEQALGDGVLRCMSSEENVKIVARKSIVARRAIAAGEVIDAAALTVKRPGTGLHPRHLKSIIGVRAISDIGRDEQVRWPQLETDRPGKTRDKG